MTSSSGTAALAIFSFFELLKNLAGLSDFFTLSSEGSCDKWEGEEISGAKECRGNLPSAKVLLELDSVAEGGR